jgi:hypothetical protein
MPIIKLIKNLLEQPSLDSLDLAASEGALAWHANSNCDYPSGPLRDAWWEGWEEAKATLHKC